MTIKLITIDGTWRFAVIVNGKTHLLCNSLQTLENICHD